MHSIDVLTYRYTDNPNNYPEDYPALVTENKEEVVLQPNWIRFTTVDDYYAYLELHKAAFEAVVNMKIKQKNQDIVWEKIKAYRDYREESGVKVAISGTDYWFHSDVKSQIKYLFLLFLATIFSSYYPSVLKWKTLGGPEVVLTTGDIILIFFKIITLGQTVFELGRIHRANMLLEADPLQYDYTTGWPPIYGEE